MWAYSADEGVSEELSTPRQIQILFAEMQAGKRRTQTTTDLCTSFGWENADQFVQQDVLELCDVMLDAIDRETRGKTETPITSIFAGKVKNCLKSECGKYSRENIEGCKELMLDLGDNKTIEAALSQFISASELTGDNQWKPTAGVGASLLCSSAVICLLILVYFCDPGTVGRCECEEMDGAAPATTHHDDSSQEIHIQLCDHAAHQAGLDLHVPKAAGHVAVYARGQN